MSRPHPDAAPDESLLVEAGFGGVVLVCGDCEKRSSRPSKIKAKHVRKQLKRGLGRQPVRLRIVQSTCLGLCPKKAITLAAVAPVHKLLAAEVRSGEEASAFAATVALSFR